MKTVVTAAAIALALACAGAVSGSTAQTAQGPAAAAAPRQVLYVQAGRLLADPASGRVETNKTVVIVDGRVAEIRDGFVAGADGRVVDLRDKFVLPGLIDSHVHMLWEGPGRLTDAAVLSEADYAVAGASYAERTLRAGFTTVQDLGAGSGGDAIFALRDGIAAGRIPGPRILAAGSTVTPHGGHADIHGFNDTVMHALARESVCSGADDCTRATRQQIQRGADVIKITATGGVLSNTAAGLAQQLTDQEMSAIVRTARQLGRRVTAHAHSAEGVNAALRAGVDSIEHGTMGDQESLRLFRQTGAWYVPTMTAAKDVAIQADQGRLTPAQAAKAREVSPRITEAVRRAREAGVKMAFGTDAGVFTHGQNAREFGYLQEAGVTPIDAIRMATVRAAEHLRLQNEIGALKPGMAGDLIAVSADPTADARVLERVDVVVKGGRVFVN